eukprot:COSAG05_NODE_1022_length_6130_cov_48.450174_3_plen_220_part_00
MPASTARRLRTVSAALSAPTAAAATPASWEAEIHGLDIPDPNSLGVPFETESGRAGNSPLGEEVQGYQRFKHHPPPFDPNKQQDEAFEFYRQNGFVVIDALSDTEVDSLNKVAVSFLPPLRPVSQPAAPRPQPSLPCTYSQDNFHKYDEAGNIIGPAELFFPMLGYPEFDFTFFHPNTLPLVKRILGGEDVPRVIEFNYRAVRTTRIHHTKISARIACT